MHLNIVGNGVVGYIEFLKNRFGCRTYHIEGFFVLLILCLTALIFGKVWEEWIAVFAVYGTFKHASISNRLEEREEQRKLSGEKVYVECYYMASRWFYIKETLWLSYFLLVESYSALAGVLIFLIYNPWRRFYRRYKPLNQ